MEAKQNMDPIRGEVRVSFSHQVHFTTGLFDPSNPLLRDVALGTGQAAPGAAVSSDPDSRRPVRVLFAVEEEVNRHLPVAAEVKAYFHHHRAALALAGPPLLLPGGEQCKNDPGVVAALHRAVNETGLDRHSYLAVVGGGALLDAAGYAAATAHRGIRLLRVPTTTLSQNDSGVGVKNGVNAFGKKNFVGTFAPPWAVLNDFRFLETLPDREWRNGIAEAVKVALIKDADFFAALEQSAPALAARDLSAMKQLVHRCAELHLRHICDGGDPFEMGSSRPLDFGHWSAHKLEQLSRYRLRHGEAVAIGIALDATYSCLAGFLDETGWRRVLAMLQAVGFTLAAPELDQHLDDPDHPDHLFRGLREFREHLGGQLTIQMLRGIGEGFNVHEIDEELMRRSILRLRAAVRGETPAGVPGVRHAPTAPSSRPAALSPAGV